MVQFGQSTNVVFDAPHFVEGSLLVEVVDYQHLTSIDLHAVPGDSVHDQEGLVRARLDPLGEFDSDLEDSFVSWGVQEKVFVISAII